MNELDKRHFSSTIKFGKLQKEVRAEISDLRCELSNSSIETRNKVEELGQRQRESALKVEVLEKEIRTDAVRSEFEGGMGMVKTATIFF